MPAVIVPAIHQALDHAERAARAAVARLSYTQRTTIARVAFPRAGAPVPALHVGERYLIWPSPPPAPRFATPRELRPADLRWTLAMRIDGDGPVPEFAAIAEHLDLPGVLAALLRELLADRFLPLRHERARRASAVARDELAQPSRSMWWFWR